MSLVILCLLLVIICVFISVLILFSSLRNLQYKMNGSICWYWWWCLLKPTTATVECADSFQNIHFATSQFRVLWIMVRVEVTTVAERLVWQSTANAEASSHSSPMCNPCVWSVCVHGWCTVTVPVREINHVAYPPLVQPTENGCCSRQPVRPSRHCGSESALAH